MALAGVGGGSRNQGSLLQETPGVAFQVACCWLGRGSPQSSCGPPKKGLQILKVSLGGVESLEVSEVLRALDLGLESVFLLGQQVRHYAGPMTRLGLPSYALRGDVVILNPKP